MGAETKKKKTFQHSEKYANIGEPYDYEASYEVFHILACYDYKFQWFFGNFMW